MHAPSEIRKIAFLGDYLPRKCGIAKFTSDVLTAVAAEHPRTSHNIREIEVTPPPQGVIANVIRSAQSVAV